MSDTDKVLLPISKVSLVTLTLKYLVIIIFFFFGFVFRKKGNETKRTKERHREREGGGGGRTKKRIVRLCIQLMRSTLVCVPLAHFGNIFRIYMYGNIVYLTPTAAGYFFVAQSDSFVLELLSLNIICQREPKISWSTVASTTATTK